jgi:hypothetical protein
MRRLVARRAGVGRRDLVALADGSLPSRSIAATLELVEESSSLSEQLASQQRAVKAIRRCREPAPAWLRERIDDERAAARLTRSRSVAPRPIASRLRLRAGSLALGGAVATAATSAVLLIGGGGAVAPTVAQAAEIAVRAPVTPVQASRSDGPVLPGVRAAGLSFPYWEDSFGLRGLGVRWDRVGGHLLTTVTYVERGRKIEYTIASGAPLTGARGAATTIWGGPTIRSFHAHGQLVVTWQRAGHTCVLTARGVPASLLVSLAAWHSGA